MARTMMAPAHPPFVSWPTMVRRPNQCTLPRVHRGSTASLESKSFSIRPSHAGRSGILSDMGARGIRQFKVCRHVVIKVCIPRELNICAKRNEPAPDPDVVGAEWVVRSVTGAAPAIRTLGRDGHLLIRSLGREELPE